MDTWWKTFSTIDFPFQLEASREECANLASKLSSGETRVQDAERRTEALATLQSHRWMEFAKMADNMKELSGAMVSNKKFKDSN